MSAGPVPSLIVSCEHGGHEVPAPYAGLFAGHQALLLSHRGWDPGALQLGLEIAAALAAPLFASTTTRLLVDLNRSLGHRQLFSRITRRLSRSKRQKILLRYYRPHRDAIESAIARHTAAQEPVFHLASHSFTPALRGVVRHADVALLFDPRRAAEGALARRWRAELAQRAPALRLRLNYPYRGRSDGLATQLRKRHAEQDYLGMEIEVNQRFVKRGGAPWDKLRAVIVESLAATLGTTGTMLAPCASSTSKERR